MGKLYNILACCNSVEEIAKIIVSEGDILKVFLPTKRSCRALKKALSRFNCIAPEILSVSFDLFNFDFVIINFLRGKLNDVPFNTILDLTQSLSPLIREIILNGADQFPDKFDEDARLTVIKEILRNEEIQKIKERFKKKMDREFIHLQNKKILFATPAESNFYTRRLCDLANKNGIIVAVGAESKKISSLIEKLFGLQLNGNAITESFSSSCGITGAEHAIGLKFPSNKKFAELRNDSDEALAVAIAIRHALELKKTILVVCPNLDLAEKIKTELLKWDIYPDNSFGIALRKITCGQILSQLVITIENGFRNADVINLLKFSAQLKDQVFIFEDFLRNQDSYSPDFFRTFSWYKTQRSDALRENESTLLDGIVAQIKNFSLPKTISSFHEWMNYFRDFLDIIDHSSAVTFDEIREKFPHDYGNITLREFCVFLNDHLLNIPLRKSENTTPGVVILGILDAQLLDADLVVICSANENFWRTFPQNNFWISPSVLMQLNLKTAAEEIEFYDCIWEALNSKPNVLITRSVIENGERTQVHRRLKNAEKNYWLEKIIRQVKRPSQPQRIEFSPPQPPFSFRPQHLWVSDFDLLINNPYVFFAKKILRLKELNQIDEQKNVKGVLLHEVFDAFIKETGTTLFELQKLVENTIKKRFISLGSLGLWYFYMDELLKFFIDNIKETATRFSEIKGSTVISVEHNDRTVSVQVSAKADRIDISASGLLSIIDYKTGEVPSIKKVKEGCKIQLPIEAIIARHDGFDLGKNRVETMHFWQLKPRNTSVVSVTETIEETNDVCDSILHKIEEIIVKHLYEPYDLNREDKYNKPYMQLARAKELTDAG